MKMKIVRKFRIEIILYSLLSLALTLVTEAVVFGGIYLGVKFFNPDYIDRMAGGYQQESKSLSDNGILGENRIFGDNSPFGSSFDQYRFNEEISVSIQLNRELLISTIALAIILGIALFIMYFLIFTRRFTRNLNDIAYGIEKISSGDFKHRIPVENVNELGIISLELNKMAYKLEQIIEENEKNEKNKNAMITSLAHDLRTPLTSITGYLDLLANNKDLSDNMRSQYIGVVYNKSKDLEHLIDELFDYTRVSYSGINTRFTTINMVQFINQLVDEFYPSFRENDLEYGVKIEESTIYIRGDGELLARAISNLIANAIKYGKDGKCINIYLKKEHDKVILQIVNYGQLIPEESLPHIFERFYRVEGSRSAETGGTGLGLAIAKEIIELHDGSINAKSNFGGTVFEVIINEQDKQDNQHEQDEQGGEIDEQDQ